MPGLQTGMVLDSAWWRPLGGRAWLQLLSAKELRIESRRRGDPRPAISTSLSLAGDVIVAICPAAVRELEPGQRRRLVGDHLQALRQEMIRMGDAGAAFASLLKAVRALAMVLFAAGTALSAAAGPAAGYWPAGLLLTLLGFSPQALLRRAAGKAVGAYLRRLARREIARGRWWRRLVPGRA